MKTKITKLTAAAAVIVIGMFIGIKMFTGTPVYALEQTIHAFEMVNSVYVEQTIREKGTLLDTKMWARRGQNGKFFFGDFRQEVTDTGDTIIVNEGENRTYNYNPLTKTVHVYKGLNVTIGDFLDEDYFLQLQQEMENVKIEYGKDEVTGREIVILKYQLPVPSKYDQSVTKSQIITFDLETKLPIRWTSWANPYFKGEPWSEWTLIEYNPDLAEDIFMFKIPQDATVISE